VLLSSVGGEVFATATSRTAAPRTGPNLQSILVCAAARIHVVPSVPLNSWSLWNQLHRLTECRYWEIDTRSVIRRNILAHL